MDKLQGLCLLLKRNNLTELGYEEIGYLISSLGGKVYYRALPLDVLIWNVWGGKAPLLKGRDGDVVLFDLMDGEVSVMENGGVFEQLFIPSFINIYEVKIWEEKDGPFSGI